MSFKIQSFLLSFIIFFNIGANGFNITKILSEYSDFSTFNSYLNQTGLVKEINSRQTITVLAVSNSNISPMSGKPVDVIKSLMSVHVALDYYDLKRLQNIHNKSIILTTLFQSSGKARKNQGFLNVTVAKGTKDVKISSASPGGSGSGVSLVGSVVQQPYNISVLEISNVIVPPGMDNVTSIAPSPSPKPAKSPSPTPAPAPSRRRRSPPAPPSDSPSDSPSPSDADPPTSSDDSANSSSSSRSSLGLEFEAVLFLLVSSVMMFLA